MENKTLFIALVIIFMVATYAFVVWLLFSECKKDQEGAHDDYPHFPIEDRI